MASLAQKITSEIRNDIGKKFSNTELTAACKKMANEAIQSNIDRIEKGLDVSGKPFAKYTSRYSKYKKNVIKYKKYSGKYAAKSMPDHMKLSGTLLKSIFFDSIQVVGDSRKIKLSFRVYIHDTQFKKVQGLYSNTGRTRSGKTYSKAKREFFGISTNPTLRIQEKNRLINVFQKAMNFSVSGRHEDIKIG